MMSQLRSVLDEMKTVPVSDLSDDELHLMLEEVLDGSDQLEVLKADLTREITSRGSHHHLGYPSPTAFLVDQGGLSAGRARRIVSRAGMSGLAPVTHAAWSDGRLSTDQSDLLFGLARSLPEEFGDAEEKLVEIVETLTVSETNRTLEYWRQAVDGPGELSIDQQQLRRGLSASRSWNGMVRVDGWLNTTTGEAFLALLDAHMPPPAENDHRTPTQRRHDAFEDIIRNQLDQGDNPVNGGEKPHVTVVTDLDGLKGIAGGLHETTTGQVIDTETIRQIACDSSISRIVLGPDSEILDVGRKTRVWSTAQRRAVTARDQHCTAQGCERPAQWCDIHHIVHWANGGKTSIENGRLLCRYHHTQQHIQDKTRRAQRPT